MTKTHLIVGVVLSIIFHGVTLAQDPITLIWSEPARTDLSCDGGGVIQIDIQGAVDPVDVFWSGPNGYTYEALNCSSNYAACTQISDLASGLYSVTVEDDACRHAYMDVEIGCEDCGLLFQYINTHGHIECEPKKGKLTVGPIGPEVEQILWSNGENTQTIENLDPDYYSVTVTDARGCSDSHGLYLRVNNPPEPTDEGDFSVLEDCAETQTGEGSIQLINTAYLDYEFEWTGPGGFSSMQQDIYFLVAGSYQVSMTDPITGCLKRIGEVEVPSKNILMGYDIKHAYEINNCEDGGIDLHLDYSEGPFRIEWTFPDGTVWRNRNVDEPDDWGEDLPESQDPGLYSVKIISQKCTVEREFEIECLPCQCDCRFDYEVMSRKCNGGRITLENYNCETCNGTFDYLWSDGSTDKNRTNLSSGTYTVTISASDGCIYVRSFDIDDDSNYFDVRINALENPLCQFPFPSENCDGYINVFAWGGIRPIESVMTMNGTVIDYRPDCGWNPVWEDLCPGHYRIEFTDAYGCRRFLDFSITCCQSSGDIQIDGEVFPITDTDTSGYITTNVSGGNGDYYCFWRDPAGSPSDVLSNNCDGLYFLEEGTYCLEVMDGCQYFYGSETQCFEIVNCEEIEPDIETNIVASCVGFEEGSIEVTSISAGNEPYEYLWSNGGANNIIENLSPGEYCVTITNASNCKFEECYYVPQTEGRLDYRTDKRCEIVNICNGREKVIKKGEVFGPFPIGNPDLWPNRVYSECHKTTDYLPIVCAEEVCLLGEELHIIEDVFCAHAFQYHECNGGGCEWRFWCVKEPPPPAKPPVYIGCYAPLPNGVCRPYSLTDVSNRNSSFDDYLEQGIEQEIENRLIVYPNPTTDWVNLELRNYTSESVLLRMFNPSGIKIIEFDLTIDFEKTLYNFNLSTFPSGLYILKLINPENGDVQTARVIKN